MHVLFFGTSPFAVPVLQALHDSPNHKILGVVTQTDKPSGRGLKLHFSPVKELAFALGYPVYQPERVRRKPFPAQVAELNPDALVVVSFGQIIPQVILDVPRFGSVNVHASLLPRWRGAAPIHHAILAGDALTGVATMQMDATLDTGPVYLTAQEPITPTDTVGTLEPRLALLGAPLLLETLDCLEKGTLSATPQTEEGVTLAPPVGREAGLLDPAASDALTLARQVRGTFPRPGTFVTIAGRPLRVLEARLVEQNGAAMPGTVAAIGKEGITLACANQTALLLMRVQPQNKGAMFAADWARGARIAPGDAAARPAS